MHKYISAISAIFTTKSLEDYYKRFIRYYTKHGYRQTGKRVLLQLTILIYPRLSLLKIISALRSPFWNKISSCPQTLKVSIIVPNYNHSEYLEERLSSIYSQTYKNYEVILLDDCSTDASRDILMRYKEAHSENTTTIFNETNSGRPFLQWLKGIEAARGDVIWIAESDDYCDQDFLEKLLPSFEDEAVLLAYCSTDFILDGRKIWDLGTYLKDFSLCFDKSFMMTAHHFVRQVMFCKNPIANASGALFRKPMLMPEYIKQTIAELKLCGDWLFYLHQIKGGVVSFVHDTKNYYRIHPQSTSLRIQKTLGFLEEQVLVLSYIASNYKIDITHIDKKYQDIGEAYRSMRPSGSQDELDKFFNRDALCRMLESRKCNIGICCFAFTIGGGEFFPIHLANALKKQGHSVTFLEFDFEKRNPMVRAVLSRDIPVVHSPHTRNFDKIAKQLGLDVLHSHHGEVDNIVNVWNRSRQYRHLVTLHGFYEAISDEERAIGLLRRLKDNAHFVYTADKHLNLVREAGIDVDALKKMPNGLPSLSIGTLRRESLGLSGDDFVLCLVSRALPSKGWEEAVEVIDLVNKKSSRSVHLLLIGEGEMYDRLKGGASKFIHFLGSQFALQEFYAISDMGFFPSRYPGESFPLVNIECLLTGTPIIASAIGEIGNQLTTEAGNIAGALFPLRDGNIPIATVAEIILSFVNDNGRLEKAKTYARELSTKFDIESVAQTYVEVYHSLANPMKVSVAGSHDMFLGSKT